MSDAASAGVMLSYMRKNFLNYRKLTGDYDFPMVVMANKCDLEDQREVKEPDLQEWCEDNLQCNGNYARNWHSAFPDDERLPVCFFSTRVVDRLEEPTCGIREALFCLARHVFIRWGFRPDSSSEAKAGSAGVQAAQAEAAALEKQLAAGSGEAENADQAPASAPTDSQLKASAPSETQPLALVARPAAGDSGLSAPRGENLSARPV
jgi:hypothetical protein